MPTYSFRCARGDTFDVLIPMPELRSTWTCPTCSQPSTRVYGAPALARLGSSRHRAADLAASSAERPHPGGADCPRPHKSL